MKLEMWDYEIDDRILLILERVPQATRNVIRKWYASTGLSTFDRSYGAFIRNLRLPWDVGNPLYMIPGLGITGFERLQQVALMGSSDHLPGFGGLEADPPTPCGPRPPSMTTVTEGDKIAQLGRVLLGCSAAVMRGETILLTRRTDNGLWCLPGGGLKAGEDVRTGCAREVQEETGLLVLVSGLIGVYSNPNYLITYPDGNQFHVVTLHFFVDVLGGQVKPDGKEVSEVAFFGLGDIPREEVMENHLEIIRDSVFWANENTGMRALGRRLPPRIK